jgi:methylthioribose-1-phosphate isomerase
MIPTLEWTDAGVRFLDQTKLPLEETYVLARDYREVADVIRTMVVRGAPAIGVSAGMGVALGLRRSTAATPAQLLAELATISDTLAATRPTAVNLFWGIHRIRQLAETLASQPGITVAAMQQAAVAEALRMYDEDIAACRAMGAHGASLLPASGGVLTHCNAGALATCGYGSALGVIRAAVERGHKIHVYADETRPFLQGARLTAWELLHDGIPTTVLCDNMAASQMRAGKIQAVIVGADRIAANGDVANKIGTYGVAILAKEHGIPFYVAAPWSTVDLATPTGEQIPIEERAAREVTHFNGRQITPDTAEISNPAFDVTPAKYVTAIITERGVLRAPYTESLAAGEEKESAAVAN